MPPLLLVPSPSYLGWMKEPGAYLFFSAPFWRHLLVTPEKLVEEHKGNRQKSIRSKLKVTQSRSHLNIHRSIPIKFLAQYVHESIRASPRRGYHQRETRHPSTNKGVDSKIPTNKPYKYWRYNVWQRNDRYTTHFTTHKANWTAENTVLMEANLLDRQCRCWHYYSGQSKHR